LTGWTCPIPRNWSFAHGRSALIVDGRLAGHGSGPAEAVGTRLTRLLSDSLAALGEKKPGSGSKRQKHPVRMARGANPSNFIAGE